MKKLIDTLLFITFLILIVHTQSVSVFAAEKSGMNQTVTAATDTVGSNQTVTAATDTVGSNQTVTAAETAASNQTITVTAADGSDISDKLREALINARDVADSSNQIVTVKVQEGHYFLSKPLHIYSNTTLDVTNVHLTFAGSHRFNMLISGANSAYKGYDKYNTSEACSGYDGFKNITVIGGTWESTDANESSIIRIFHATNVTLDGLTVTGGACVHQVEVAAINGFYVKNCTFQNHGKNADNTTNREKEEAIQLDMPYSTQVYPGTYQDGTPMKNVEITNNTFQNIARGVGTHTMLCGAYHQNINISNNTFINVLEECIICLNYVNCQIKDNTITKCGGGILVENCKEYNPSINTSIHDGAEKHATTVLHDLNTEISGNTIQINYRPTTFQVAGIFIYGRNITEDVLGGDGYAIPKKDYFVSSVYVRNNTIVTAGDGIIVSDAKDCELSGNTIKGYGFSANDTSKKSRDGIRINHACSGISITGNSIKNMPRSGIYIYQKSSVSNIVNNTISGCSRIGIFLTESSSCTYDITNNTVKKCSAGGILIGNNSRASDIIGNVVSKTGGKAAIRIYNSSSAGYINSNRIYDMGKMTKKRLASGIELTGHSFAKGIAGNQIYASKNKNAADFGIVADYSSRISDSIENNTISDTVDYSIAVKNKARVSDQISKNRISGSKKSAIAVTSSGFVGNGIENNTIASSETNGIYLDGKTTTCSRISNNTISDCTNYGINVQHIKNTLSVTHNTINENGNSAINIAANKKNLITISENTLSGSSKKAGIQLSKCKTAIFENTISGFKYAVKTTSVSGSIYDNIYSEIKKKEYKIDGSEKQPGEQTAAISCTPDYLKNQVTITWDSLKNISGYELQYSTDADFSNSCTKRFNADQTFMLLHDMPKNKTVYCRIRGYKVIGSICIFYPFQTTNFIMK